ncbi:MAG: hypothetical protein M3Z21_12755, partial [Pseudomonadota bacterium]|nr:hypothetical protein [Pseudomonadota bacterium]
MAYRQDALRAKPGDEASAGVVHHALLPLSGLTAPGVMAAGLRHLGRRVYEAAMRSTAASEFTFLAAGMIGLVGFPLYYVIWHDWFPQPYENLALRLVGALLCLGLAVQMWWPPAWQRCLPLYWHLTMLYSLPFFFTFMMLKNDFSVTWLVSETIGLFLLIMLVVDWGIILLIFTLGTALAWVVYWLSVGQVVVPPGYDPIVWPLFGFAVSTGGILNYRHQLGLR